MNSEHEGAMTARLRRLPADDPVENDDLLSEILLRLTPEPSSLPRASLVCKRWRRLVSDPGFCRRFHVHHRCNPPILGLFPRYQSPAFVPTLEAPNRIPPWRFSLPADIVHHSTFLGCRHGLVLLYLRKSMQVLVWDPITGDKHRIDLPPMLIAKGAPMINGAVLRAAGAGHVHFQVVLVMADDDDNPSGALACVYLSETGVWGGLSSTTMPSLPEVYVNQCPTVVCAEATVLVGGSLYWPLFGYFVGALEFDLDSQRLAVIQMPVDKCDDFTIMRTEDGGLGFLILSDFIAQVWSRITNCNGVASWVLRRTIELDKLLSLNLEKKTVPPTIAGFAEYSNVVLLWTGSLFMIQLESLQFKKLSEANNMVSCNPFETVYATCKSMP